MLLTKIKLGDVQHRRVRDLPFGRWREWLESRKPDLQSLHPQWRTTARRSGTSLFAINSFQCDQMMELKGSPNVYKSCPNSWNRSSYINLSFSKGPKSQQSFRATLVSKFVTKNFQKSPKLVTLTVFPNELLKNKFGQTTKKEPIYELASFYLYFQIDLSCQFCLYFPSPQIDL